MGERSRSKNKKEIHDKDSRLFCTNTITYLCKIGECSVSRPFYGKLKNNSCSNGYACYEALDESSGYSYTHKKNVIIHHRATFVAKL